MPLWGKNDAVSNTSQEWVAAFNKKANTANRGTFYGNTTTGNSSVGVVVGQKTGVFAVTDAEMAKRDNLKITAAVVGSNGGANYANNDTVTVAFGTMSVNALFTVTTNSSGGVASLVVTNTGVFTLGPNTSPSVATTNKTVANASANGLLVTLTTDYAYEGKKVPHTGWNVRKVGTGGRAGRVQYETLVAGGISGSSNGNSTAILG
jgi:hypothetical protein